MNKLKIPFVSICLMIVFLLGGSLILVVKWPQGPANLDWGVWILNYFGYIYLIAATLYYVKKGK